ncbi:MAG: amino acid permease [Pseudomonadota bacterium]|nr:amino acid permease [Pseudomonadota bacterium]
MANKMGFWPVYAIVLGSQIGSGVFMLPSGLAPYGYFSALGWLLAGFGAVSLAMVFVALVARVPKTGGPHAFVAAAFSSPVLTFFTGWTYWLISALSTVTVIASSISYLSPFLPDVTPQASAFYQLVVLAVFVWINLQGVSSAGRVEVVLMIVKILTLTVIPLYALGYFNGQHFQVSAVLSDQSGWVLLGRTTMLAFWGFIGLETATTPAESVANPKVTIPIALIVGTLSVMLLYLLNSVSIQGLISPNVLSVSQAPYTDAVKIIWGGSWYLALAVMAALIFLSNLNAWLLTCGQVALGLANDGYLPAVFQKVNRRGSPYWGLLVSACFMVPLILSTLDSNVAKQVELIIELSVAAFIYVYIICTFGLLNLLLKEARPWYYHGYLSIAVSLVFLVMMLVSSESVILLTSGAFVLSGLPLYVFWYRSPMISRT